MNKIKVSLMFIITVLFFFACKDNDSTVNNNNNNNNNDDDDDTTVVIIDTTAPYITEIGDGITQLIMGNGYTIKGKKFGTTRGKVYLANDIEAILGKWTDTTINITTDEKLAPGEMYVVNADGKKGNKFAYTVAPNTIYPMMIYIKGGNFIMGDNNSEIAASKPEHNITVNSFYMSATEVTQKQYKEIMLSKVPDFNPKDEEYPANYVRFADAARFCNKLSEIHNLEPCYSINDPYNDENFVTVTCDFTKSGYRLPTEAEWEYAAKANSTSLWGVKEPVSNYAYYGISGSKSTPSKPQQKLANDFGLYDMNGNLAEIVWDWYDDNYYTTSPTQDPKGPVDGDGETRMIKGGSFRDNLDALKVASKQKIHRIQREITIGFRIVKKVK